MKISSALCALVLLSGCAAAQEDPSSEPDAFDDIAQQEQALTPCASGPTCLVGTYAVRSARFRKTRSDGGVSGAKTVDYLLVTIARNWNGTLRFTEKLCYSETVPLSPSGVYEWSKPSWLSALPAIQTNLSRNANGTYTRAPQVVSQGWSAARQPASCTASSTPLAPWPASWGATCRCNAPATSLPPFSRALPYDCRATDADLDGYPGWSRFAALTPPATPASDATGTGARLLQASNKQTRWTITASGDGRHEATLTDDSPTSIIGCVGSGGINMCSFLSGNPVSATCPQRFNKALFVPASTSSDTCDEIVAARGALFSSANDGSLPSDAACPPPA